MEHLTVAVDDDHLETIADVATALAGKGMVVDEVLPSVGVILGSVADVDPAELAAVEGVASVEGATTYQLPPPESDIQ